MIAAQFEDSREMTLMDRGRFNARVRSPDHELAFRLGLVQTQAAPEPKNSNGRTTWQTNKDHA